MARQSRSFNGLVACGHRGVQIARPDGTLELFNVNIVSTDFFRVMDVQAVRGRVFTSQDGASLDRQPVVVLGHDFWMRRFGGDPTIVGRQIRLDRADMNAPELADRLRFWSSKPVRRVGLPYSAP